VDGTTRGAFYFEVASAICSPLSSVSESVRSEQAPGADQTSQIRIRCCSVILLDFGAGHHNLTQGNILPAAFWDRARRNVLGLHWEVP